MEIKNITDGMVAIKELISLITRIGEETNNLALQKAILELDKKNYKLEKELHELKKELDKKETFNMQYDSNCYWNKKENGNVEGPYCSICWDKDKNAIRLTQNSTMDKRFFICGNCKNEFYVKNYKQRG